MKKIGIVSCYFNKNYGSMLQAYALKKVLDNNNIPNETVDIDNNVDFKRGKRKYYLSKVFDIKFIRAKFGMAKMKFDKIINRNLGKNIKIRETKYNEFKKEFNLSRKCKNYKDLNRLALEKYSNVIVGSDQLWLPVNVVADFYTLNWVPNEINKISYATSFGVSKISKNYFKKYYDFLNRINYLSTREESGVNIIKEITGRDSKLVADPTLLLTKEEWEKEAITERIIREKYIFCYFLGSNIEHRKFAERLRNETGCRIVSLNHADEYVKYSDKFCDYALYDIGPREWINLIQNAEYICTDSFHGTVFSILFNKKFFDFRRYSSKSKVSTNSRIDSLLKVSGISDSIILTGKEDPKEVLNEFIDYTSVNERIDAFRQSSKKWLLESINLNHDESQNVELSAKSECCGCTACMSSCPRNAIKMKEDEEGFLYPLIDKTKCVNCGMCKKRCPVINKQHFNSFNQRAFIFQNIKGDVREKSTSGGFYSAISEYVIKNNGIVIGASFNDDWVVEHTMAKTIDEINKFRKSKYVQSNLNDIFIKIRDLLNDDKLVCFSGTPCQVAGLKIFLNKDYSNLILVDIMCHSVPSPLFFEKYKEHILKKMNAKKILAIDFRDKSKYGYKYSMMTIKTDNGTYCEGIDIDPYLRAFFGDYSVRPSCFDCAFKTQKRVSDITMWDCFNIGEINKSFDDDKGTSRILIQSEKGLNILNQLTNVKFEEIELETALSKVHEMTNSVKYNMRRDWFFENISNGTDIDHIFPVRIKNRIESFVRKFLSRTGMYIFVKRNLKRILKK